MPEEGRFGATNSRFIQEQSQVRSQTQPAGMGDTLPVNQKQVRRVAQLSQAARVRGASRNESKPGM